MYHCITIALPGRQLYYTRVPNRPYPAAYMWGACSCPWGSLLDLRTPGAAKGAAYAGAAPSIAAFDRGFQRVLAARPQLCTALKVPRVL